ncbi:hypothetical protein [Nereida ignava]|uniref:hypothetical protein n=1 Tax=Nereida ignava TaxID=282199 RepID=UPI0030FAA0ED
MMAPIQQPLLQPEPIAETYALPLSTVWLLWVPAFAAAGVGEVQLAIVVALHAAASCLAGPGRQPLALTLLQDALAAGWVLTGVQLLAAAPTKHQMPAIMCAVAAGTFSGFRLLWPPGATTRVWFVVCAQTAAVAGTLLLL